MDSLLIILVIIIGILFATGLWKTVFQSIFGGIVKLVITVVVILAIVAFVYQRFIA